MPRFARFLRRMFVGHERTLALSAVSSQPSPQRPVDEFMEGIVSRYGGDHAPLHNVGKLAGIEGDYSVILPLREFVGAHRWTTGSTNSGKSVQVLSEEIQLIQPEMDWGIVHLDAKSESANWLTDLFVPARVSTWDREDIKAFFGSYNVVNPFDEDNLPPLNILHPLPDVPRSIHAREIASLIGDALESRGEVFGHRMLNVLFFALRLALDIGGLSLLEVRSLLINPEYLNGLLRFLKDPEVREYFVYRFPSENKEAIHAVVSRLDLLLLEDTARVLCAPGRLSFDDLIESRLSVINIGNPPRGAEYLSRWWMGVFVKGLTRAILSRQNTERPVFAVWDEWWLGLDAEMAANFERLLALARHKRVGLWLINQLSAQIGSKYPELLAVLRNSCAYQIAFRQSFEDASGFAHIFPHDLTRRMLRDPDGPAYETKPVPLSEQRREHVEQLSRLPNRHFWFYPRGLGLHAQLMTSLTVDFEDARARVAELPDWFLSLCKGHGDALTRDFLDETVGRRRAHVEAVAGGKAARGSPSFYDDMPYDVHGDDEPEESAHLGDDTADEVKSAPAAGADSASRSTPAAKDHSGAESSSPKKAKDNAAGSNGAGRSEDAGEGRSPQEAPASGNGPEAKPERATQEPHSEDPKAKKKKQGPPSKRPPFLG